MFHPIGPNFLLSYTIAWKKHSENSKVLKASGLSHSSRSLSFILLYCVCRFSLMPCGGSMVILIPFWRILTGKCESGIEVSHNRNSLCTLSSISSHSISSCGIQEVYKWQFCKSTQEPLTFPSSMFYLAFLSCPCPNEIDSCFLIIPFSSQNFNQSETGSQP